MPDAVAEEFASDSLRVVRREGDAVVRRTGWWTPAVHGLLRHLEERGFAESVRVLGIDADGNEVLRYVEGTSGEAAWAEVVPEAGLREYARLIRRYHDAVRDHRPDDGLEWMTRPPGMRPGELVAHGDPGPWNTVWRDGRPVALLDWDLAGPRPPLYDVAYALEYVAPFRSDEHAMRFMAHPSPPDRPGRIRTFAAAYGLLTTDGLVDAVIAQQESTLADTLALAARGLHPHVEWVAEGFADEQRARIAWSRAHRDLLG